jgi:fused signal recognition particle receptor
MISFSQVTKRYPGGHEALSGVDLSIEKGELVFLTGHSGAGKSTLLKLVAAIERPTGGVVSVSGQNVGRLPQRAIPYLRRNIGLIFQDHKLLFDRNVIENVVLADTAGRLPTQLHLMEEIRKVKRVIEKAIPGAPHEVLLVLDANTGQNAVAQVKAFDDALGVTGLVLTKLDGTAKGGAIAAIAQARSSPARPIPVRYIGVGETVDDLRPFDAREFVEAIFSA